MRLTSVIFKTRTLYRNIPFVSIIYRPVNLVKTAVTLVFTRNLINLLSPRVARPTPISPVMSSSYRRMGNTNKGGDSSDPGSGTNDGGRTTRSTVDSVELKNRDFYMNMPLEEKRNLYRCKNKYFTMDQIQAWPDYAEKIKEDYDHTDSKVHFDVIPELNMKVSLWKGDITALEIDAIVNAANSSLLGGGGVDGCIHRAAGKKLVEECAKLKGCPTGQAKLTGGYKLPAKYIIHTVGPIGVNALNLQSCYKECLEIAKEKNIRTVAFPCISTGIYGYDVELATPVVLATIREWLLKEDNSTHIDKVVFCVFLSKDVEVYEKTMLDYFPVENPSDKDGRRAAAKAKKKEIKLSKNLKTSKKEQKVPDVKNMENDETRKKTVTKTDDKSDEIDKKNMKKTEDAVNTKNTRSALKESTGNTAQVKSATDKVEKTEDKQVNDGDETITDDNTNENTERKVSMSLTAAARKELDEDTSPAAKKRPPAEGVGTELPKIATKL